MMAKRLHLSEKPLVSELFYRLFIALYSLSIRIVAFLNPKARLWLQGRKNILVRMQQAIDPSANMIWFHCASLGEFEQGRPVIEELKKRYPNYKILLTFFSPSGYEVRKDYAAADYIFYLPADTHSNAVAVFNIVQPKLVVFIKYEFWFYYLQEANKRGIPLLLVSGIFRKDQPFFKWYGKLHRQMLQYFTWLLVQNEQSAVLLSSIGMTKNVVVTGDTRFDRVVAIAEKFSPIEKIEEFINGADVIVAGSTWLEDDKELDHYANTRTNIKFIIAPHNISPLRLNECKRWYKNSIRFSELQFPADPAINTLIIDNIGMLSKLYKYATVSLVGGGFGDDGVHNVLEAAVYGCPVVFGPEYDKYIEAVELVECGGGISIETALELEKVLDDLMQKGQAYTIASGASYNYVQQKKGATEKITTFIQEKRLLTN
jgi:3-deoxy-D-manno-octulosonic-acid transferase